MLLIIHYWLILIWLNILVLRNTVSQCPAIKDCIHNDESKVTNIGNWICKIFQYLISHERVGIILSDAGQTHISDSVSRCSFHSKVTSLNHWLEMRPKKRAFNKVQKFSIVPTGKSPIHIIVCLVQYKKWDTSRSFELLKDLVLNFTSCEFFCFESVTCVTSVTSIDLTVLFDCRSSEETDLHGQHASLSDVKADRQEGETEHCSLSQWVACRCRCHL